MTIRRLHVISGALIITFAASPGAANVTGRVPSVRAPRAQMHPMRPPRQGLLYLRVPGSTKILSLDYYLPEGCSPPNGSFSFVGGPGNPNPNVAGGPTSGILAGNANNTCDPSSVVGGGNANTIGDGVSTGANEGTFAGESNGNESSSDGFIGGGANNALTVEDPQYSPGSNYSGILTGYKNVIVSSSDAAIVTGEGNSIVWNPHVAFSQDSFIGGGNGNSIVADYSGILSGVGNSIESSCPTPLCTPPSSDSAIGGGSANGIGPTTYAFIGGGANNYVGGAYSTVSGGYKNSVSGAKGAISGGYLNAVSGNDASIVGGSSNTVSGSFALVGGGATNIINSNGAIGGATGAAYATIAGGLSNTIKALVSSGAKYGFIGGGHANTLSGFNAVVAGGESNLASADYATVPGGIANEAEGYGSFAGGVQSEALNDGSFVWSDDSAPAKILKSSAANQFLARAAGGFYLYSTANLSTGVKLAAGSGSWSIISDRAAKTAVEDIDDESILAKVAAMPVSEWSYTAQGTSVRHLGPMAQDFRSAFGLGEDDKHISTVDEEGVALAAIKALQAEVAAKERKLDDLDAKYARLEQRLEVLEQQHTGTR